MNKVPELTIFFPFWNEEKNIEQVVKKAIPTAKKVADKWEILMIDDGSSDKTAAVGKKLAEQNPNTSIPPSPARWSHRKRTCR